MKQPLFKMYSTLALYVFAIVIIHDTEAIKYVSIGCFRDKMIEPRPLPQLLKNLRSQIDWHNLNKTINACAKQAKGNGYLYFGVQFYGECWSGPLAYLTYDKDGPSKDCIAGVGKGRANFVYMLTGEESECSDYATLSSADRSKTHVTVGLPNCDNWRYGFRKRWYRFTGKAGLAMADKCVNPSRCQTDMTGWMYGQHPKVVDGIRSRRVCFSWKNNCCYSSSNISVRNCGKFYVYKLPSTEGCNRRYCGNGRRNHKQIRDIRK